MGNSNGTYQTTREASMRAYDKLPPMVREAVANAAFDWAPQPIVTLLRKGHSPERIVAAVAAWDEKEIKKVLGKEGRAVATADELGL